MIKALFSTVLTFAFSCQSALAATDGLQCMRALEFKTSELVREEKDVKSTKVVHYYSPSGTDIQINRVINTADEILVGWEVKKEGERTLVMYVAGVKVEVERYMQNPELYATFAIERSQVVEPGYYLAAKYSTEIIEDAGRKLETMLASATMRKDAGLKQSLNPNDLQTVFNLFFYNVHDSGSKVGFKHGHDGQPILIGQPKVKLTSEVKNSYEGPTAATIKTMDRVTSVGAVVLVVGGIGMGMWVVGSIVNELGNSGFFMF